MTAAAIDARGLGKDFGAVRALDRLDLEIRDGEFFGLLGPNGAGKTTTVHLLATLLAPSRGTARVAGHDVAREGLAVRRHIGLVFQETTLDRDLTITENLRFAARLWSLPDRVARPRIDAVLRQFGLWERRYDSVRGLSGGLRRAADIARGILTEPRILFLDEPTAGLDPRARRAPWEQIRGLRAGAGAGFATVFAGRNEIDYRIYMAPGLLGMVVMFGSLLAALSTVTDREAGVLRMVLVAPIRRSTVALGKTLGATALGTTQAVAVAALMLPLVHLRPTLGGAGLALVAIVLSGLALGALGLVLAASMRSIENFAGVMNFVIFPMLFLSGALYPVRHLGPVLRIAALVNPLAYGVH